ncbi:MAG: glycosyltransferase family 4 protein [Treponema sp.]|jgi:glycosyltransferase involved in cell wall biosynthesis|nr:glycosyltransferase family 4 protein [Treponema sp.]
MKISIDCRMAGASGIGVYLRGCLPFFLSSPDDFLLIGSKKELNPFGEGRTNVNIIDCAVKTFSFKELFFFPPAILKVVNQTDLYYSPFFNIPGGITVPVYTTIHDIIFPDMPELTSKAGLVVRMFFYRRAVKKSKKIFTVSIFSKSRIEYHLGKTKPVIVTHSALQPFLQKLTTGKKNDTIIFIGNIKKHKGLSVLLEAFLDARKEGVPYTLIIVGGKDNFRSQDRDMTEKIEAADENAVKFTGYIGDEELKNLLAGASLLVQPSFYEGFGLPPLEAMCLGTRALISDIPVFREIYAGFPVTFFRAGDAVDLKNKMLTLLTDKKNHRPLVLPDHLRNKYTFKKTASIIMDELTT